MSQPLTINNWQRATAQSPHEGFGLMRNVDIESFPGALKVGKQPISLFHTAKSVTFTVTDVGNNICTATDLQQQNALTTGIAVTVSSTVTLPAGLSAATIYYIIRVDQNAGTFKLATTITNANAGTAIDITDTGTGVHTITTVDPGTIRESVKHTALSYYFFHDSNGRVWYTNSLVTTASMRLLVGNTIANSAGRGLASFTTSDGSATYLFVTRNAVLDVCNVTTQAKIEDPVGQSAWTASWQNLNTAAGTGNSHRMQLGQDNIIYMCDARYVNSIAEKAGQVFAPGNAATYTYSNQALDLPQGEIAEWVEELGNNILVAGLTYNKIYPWDRISVSFDHPLSVPEIGVYRLKNIGEIVYICAGLKGNIYQTQGTYTRPLVKLADQVINNAGTLQTNIVTWGGIGSKNGNLVVGIGVLTTGNSGVYMIFPDGRYVIDNQPHSGSANVTTILENGDFYVMGFASGISAQDTTRYAAYETVVQSGLYKVATKTGKGQYSNLELQIAKPVAGHVRIGYRTDTTSAFTTLDTFTTDTSNTSYQKPELGLTDLENLQVQVEADGSVEIMEVRLTE